MAGPNVLNTKHIFIMQRGACVCAVLAIAMCLSVCRKSDFYQNSWMDRAQFGTHATLDLSYIVLEGNSGMSKNKGNFLCNFVPNSGLITNCKLFQMQFLVQCNRGHDFDRHRASVARSLCDSWLLRMVLKRYNTIRPSCNVICTNLLVMSTIRLKSLR